MVLSPKRVHSVLDQFGYPAAKWWLLHWIAYRCQASFLRAHFCARFHEQKSHSSALSVSISMNVFPLAGTLPMRWNAARWATFPCACCPYQCNTHVHDLDLVKTMKRPSDDQANSIILQTRFRVHGNTFFSFVETRQWKRVRGKLASAWSSIVSCI